jgi:hypothetical protein
VKRRPNRVTGLQWAQREFADLLRRAADLLPPSERKDLLALYHEMLERERSA